MQTTKFGALLLASLVATGCFFSTPESKRIVGDYCLDKWPQHFVIAACSSRAKLQGATDTGPLEGSVQRLGWDERLIVAERKAMVGGAMGWMILDTARETLEGPLTEEQLRDRLPGEALSALKIVEASEAWDRLR